MGRPFTLGVGPPVTKESRLRQRSKTFFDADKGSHTYEVKLLQIVDM